MSNWRWLCVLIGFLMSLVVGTDAGAANLDNDTFDKTIGNTQLVFLNFYADWCRFSQMLSPIWDELAEKVAGKHPGVGVVAVAKVDCEKQSTIASRFHISKYPTLKLLRNGQVVKKEYRGQRSADAMADFITEQLKDPIVMLDASDDLKKAKDEGKRALYGYFDAGAESSSAYLNFLKLGTSLKDDCRFYVGLGDVVKALHPPGGAVVTYSGGGADTDETFLGDAGDAFPDLLAWATDRCIPLVREITFQNAEELTEEGLPFLILFHAPEDMDSPKAFRALVARELVEEKQNVNFLIADGVQFAHPLHHLGKEKKDLPLIAIDSFRHMYLFKDYSHMEEPGTIKTFLADLYSGKLHKEFHYGPEDEPQQLQIDVRQPLGQLQERLRQAGVPIDGGDGVRRVTSPPESTFRKLGPSKNRYTLLKEEL